MGHPCQVALMSVGGNLSVLGVKFMISVGCKTYLCRVASLFLSIGLNSYFCRVANSLMG
jgi:hypothetical protein